MTVVFGPDTFTVGSDIAINLYPSGSPKYGYNNGSGTQLTVKATTDRVETTVLTVEALARCTDAAMPSGDQQVTATCYTKAAGSDSNGNPAVRCATVGTANGYFSYTSGGTVYLYRMDSGVDTQLTSAARTFTAPGANTISLKATGTNPVVLEVSVAGTAVVTFSDSSASRKQTGSPGIYLFDGVTQQAFVDDFTVDNLVVAPTGDILPQMMQHSGA